MVNRVRLRGLAVAAALSLLGGSVWASVPPRALAATTPCTVQPTPTGIGESVHAFAPTSPGSGSTPNGTYSQPMTTELVRLIDNAACGSLIYLSAYDFGGSQQVSNALINAMNNNRVFVWMVMDGSHAAVQPGGKALINLMNAHSNEGGYAICDDGNGSCIGHKAAAHNKFFYFTQTVDWNGNPATNVLWDSTANYLPGLSGDESYNDALEYVDGDGGLSRDSIASAFLNYWNDMWDYGQSATADPDYYHDGEASGAARTDTGLSSVAYYTPEATGNFMDTLLKNVNNNVGSTTGCKTPGSYGLDSSHTLVRVAVSGWTGDTGLADLADLNALGVAGCTVDIVFGGADDVDTGVFAQMKADAAAGHIAARYFCNTRTSTSDPTLAPSTTSTHEKTIMVGGAFNGASSQRLLITGSLNFSDAALRQSDNNVIRISNDLGGTYDTVSSQFSSYLWHDTHLLNVSSSSVTASYIGSHCANALAS
jgi:hypothetical protein